MNLCQKLKKVSNFNGFSADAVYILTVFSAHFIVQFCLACIMKCVYNIREVNTVMINEKSFGGEYTLYTIKSKNGVSVSVTDLGATIQSIIAPDRNGEFADIVLGYDTPEEYLRNDGYLGATIGRYANRIAGARFSLDGEEYRITANEGENTLHGGNGFDKKRFELIFRDEDTLIFELASPDGENGFPGKLTADVLYRLNDSNELQIIFSASSDKDTVVNMCNHSYFNLRGEGKILDHELMINADRYTPVDSMLIPTGELRRVEGTDFDFRKIRRIGEGFYDHNFALNDGTLCAEVYEPCSGRTLRITTDMPGVQFYAGGCLTQRRGKNGAVYSENCGFCLETQFFPDSPNKPDFPSCVLRGDEMFMKKTVLKFGIK